MRSSVFCLLVLLLAGCAVQNVFLAPPPNLFSTGKNYPAEEVPPVLRSVTPKIFYLTDRSTQNEGEAYGAERSNQMVFGQANVEFGANDWGDLLERTYVDGGRRISQLDVGPATEIVRFDDVPLTTERRDGELRFLQAAAAEYARDGRALQDAVRAEIKRTGNGRVLLFAHGVGNGFDKSLTTLANLWHFSGRKSIPIAFSWPAGNGGVLGYFRDREADDFSVYHAKELLRLLAEIPEVEDIDIVAHSRGTDIMTKALREQVIFYRGAGKLPKLAMKTGTLVLAAADLDVGVVEQRLQAERFSEAFEQINIYVNPSDGALRLSSILTNAARLGAANEETFNPEELNRLGKAELIFFIRAENLRGRGHSYFRDNPAVLSDIVLLLLTRAFPGGTLRPLELGDDGFWQLHSNYPLDRLPDLSQRVEGSDR